MYKLSSFLPFITTTLILFSCEMSPTVLEDDFDSEIREAQKIWQNHFEKKSGIEYRASEDISPVWNKYIVYNRNEKDEFISIPLAYTNNRFIQRGAFKVDLSLASYLLYVKGESSADLYLVEIAKASNRAGTILAFDLNKNFVKGYRYEENNYIPISIGERKVNSKSVNCYYIDYYTCTVRDSGPDDCELDYSLLHCDLNIAEPPSLFPGGDGGGGGDGDNFMKPIKCANDNPSDNSTIYFLDANGNCVRTCASGYMVGIDGDCIEGTEPCDNDPLGNMEISDWNSGKSANRFGCVRNDVEYSCDNEQGKRMHKGIDLKASIGTPVHSLVSGTVADVRHTDQSSGYGHNIVIRSGNLYYMYAHLESKPDLIVGGTVSAGQIIGSSGDSDTAGEPHLHLEVRSGTNGFYNGTAVNIEDYLGTKFDENGNTLINENCY